MCQLYRNETANRARMLLKQRDTQKAHKRGEPRGQEPKSRCSSKETRGGGWAWAGGGGGTPGQTTGLLLPPTPPGTCAWEWRLRLVTFCGFYHMHHGDAGAPSYQQIKKRFPLGLGRLSPGPADGTRTCDEILLLASDVQRDPADGRGRGRVDELDVPVRSLEHLGR